MSQIKQNVILDVGANSGDFCIPIAILNPDCRVIAFEPIPELRAIILEKKKASKILNLEVREEAILDVPGEVTLNISDKGDWGISSVLSLDQKNIENHDYWATRKDLEFANEIKVFARTLQDVLQELEIQEVSFIKIDCQGVDLKVLGSLGTIKVKAGMLEAPTTKRSSLYIGEPDLLTNLETITRLGYTVCKIKPNDPACAEVNIYFEAPPHHLEEIEMELSLRDVGIYSAKDYWLRSGPNLQSLEGAENEILRVNLELKDHLALATSELDRNQFRVQHLQARLLEMENSISWRYTRLARIAFKPFAKAIEKFRKI